MESAKISVGILHHRGRGRRRGEGGGRRHSPRGEEVHPPMRAGLSLTYFTQCGSSPVAEKGFMWLPILFSSDMSSRTETVP